MFELTRDVVDDIIFAMEDQDGAWMVEVETGRLIAREEACEEGDQVDLPKPETAPVPDWSPREGFKLMEGFASRVRQPTARHALHEALAHGRGVFKAFKAALVPYPDIEKSFRENKGSVMGRVIREWYDELREAKGLERLGAEPEDSSDLVATDLGYSSGLASVAREPMLVLLGQVGSEMAPEAPAAIVARETRLARAELEGEDWMGVWVQDGEGGAIAGAAGRLEFEGGQAVGRIFFLAVDPEFRTLGLARSLIERLSADLGGNAGSLIIVDLPMLYGPFEKSLFSSGFTAYGARAWRRG
ncbi:MAG: hypothetical protein M0001_16770 [Treponema sp.]|nr:hypothetical protein [Treponema sp.]